MTTPDRTPEPLLPHPTGYVPRTATLQIYFKARGSTQLRPKLAALTAAELKFVDDVYELCAKNYQAGGDTVIECYAPSEVVKNFKNMDDVRELCGLKVEQELNAREGTDQDHALQRARAFDQGWK